MSYKKCLFLQKNLLRARECFGERFNYNYVEYYSMMTEIKIICPAHVIILTLNLKITEIKLLSLVMNL